jgi:serine/threonine protein kinase
MYILLTGRPPYNGKSDKEIQRAIVAGSSLNLDSKFFGSISESAKDLITQLLTYKPTNRISAKDALSHDWIT